MEKGIPDFEREKRDKRSRSGLSFGMASFFMIAQMSGAGFLALPKAIANAGWTGVGVMIFCCGSICYLATRLGKCWLILEERWPEYQSKNRQPYMDIAFRSFGEKGRKLVFVILNVSLIGTSIVFINLISQMMNSLLPMMSQCEWTLITVAVFLPVIWLGSPKDFWQASILAVVATVVAIIVIVTKMILDKDRLLQNEPQHPNPSIQTFVLAFGTIFFAFGGAAVFPTIQNDMKRRSDFWISVVLSFSVILCMYLPVAVTGYALIGDEIQSNVLLSIEKGNVVTVAIALQIINLAGTLVITMNPVLQSIEGVFQIPKSFCWQRVLIRSSLLLFELAMALAIPDFGLILNLIGGSTVTMTSFILPCLMYMKLVDDKTDKIWPERHISALERISLWSLIGMALVGGMSTTISSTIRILRPKSFKNSCFVNFFAINNTSLT